jgi:hypothetical protein
MNGRSKVRLMSDAEWHHFLAVQALARGIEMRSEVSEAESRRAGAWEAEDVRRAEAYARANHSSRGKLALAPVGTAR